MKAVNSVNCSACGLCLQSSLLLLRSEIKVILKMQMHLFCYKVNNRRDKAHLSALLILSELSSLSLPSHTFPPRSHNSPAFLLIYDECLHLFFFSTFPASGAVQHVVQCCTSSSSVSVRGTEKEIQQISENSCCFSGKV